MVASCVLEIRNDNVNRTFDYNIPTKIKSSIQIGQRVLVPFRNKSVMGIIVEIKDQSSFSDLKDIEEVLDIVPSLNKELIELGLNMAKYYFSLNYQALITMIPQALRIKHEKIFKVINRDLLPFSLYELFTKDEIIYDKKYQEYLDDLNLGLKNGSLILVDEVHDKNNIIKEKYLKIKDSNIDLNPNQQFIVNEFVEKNQILKKELTDKYSSNRVNTLIKKGVLEEVLVEKYRQFDLGKEYQNKVVDFNVEQIKAYQEIKESYGKNDTILLHGVTGSGKTEIYLQVLEDIIQNNQTAIYLVPEISLTPQIVGRIKGRFGEQVAVLHSGLSEGEKYDEWRKIINKEVRIVVGARSAIFAPLENIGCIIIDEEHEQSYKQFDQSPRYDARLIARIRARNNNAIVILGSATPSIESYYQAQNGRFKLIKLLNRANQKASPKVLIVDMKEELKNGNKTIFSNSLLDAIKNNLNKKEQTILLLNRRGYSSFILCRNCGEVIKCPNCEISLTYHKVDNSLRCHYCDYRIKMVSHCPKCQSEKIMQFGSGTEKVCQELNELFKEARIIRMDRDNTTTKGAHEKIINTFINQEADILVGTQMISKGLDFPKCSLVGILNADLSLKYPSYLAPSESYSLLVQTSGRAGRHKTDGKVIIQGYDPNHYAIIAAKEENYLTFYNQEIKYRQIGNYPPFVKMIEIMVLSSDYEKTYEEASKISLRFKKNKIRVLGPCEDYLVKINQQYRFKIVIKYEKEEDISSLLNKLYLDYNNNKFFRIHITRG